MARLPILDATKRELWVKSGNQCAFPGCERPLFNSEGAWVGQICHISAAEPGGERYDPNISDEDRRSSENLMLMCYDHHIVTNNVSVYSSSSLIDMKKSHEANFSDINGKVNQMKSDYLDTTKINADFEPIKTMKKLNVTLFKSDERSDDDILEDITAFNKSLSAYFELTIDARKVFVIIFDRATPNNNHEEYYIDARQLERIVLGSNSHYGERNHLHSCIDELERSNLIYQNEDNDCNPILCLNGHHKEYKQISLLKEFLEYMNTSAQQFFDGKQFYIVD